MRRRRLRASGLRRREQLTGVTDAVTPRRRAAQIAPTLPLAALYLGDALAVRSGSASATADRMVKTSLDTLPVTSPPRSIGAAVAGEADPARPGRQCWPGRSRSIGRAGQEGLIGVRWGDPPWSDSPAALLLSAWRQHHALVACGSPRSTGHQEPVDWHA